MDALKALLMTVANSLAHQIKIKFVATASLNLLKNVMTETAEEAMDAQTAGLNAAGNAQLLDEVA